MKKFIKFTTISLMTALLVCGSSLLIKAEETTQIKTGVYIENIDVSGMTAEEAQAAVEDYVAEISSMPVTLRAAQGNEIEVSAADFGMEWSNTDIVEDALSIGTKGNPIARYKEVKDLENNGVTYHLEYTFDDAMVAQVIQDKCAEFDQHAQNATMERVNGEFVIHEEVVGAVVDELCGEKIDIVVWSEDPCEYVKAALSPADVVSVSLISGQKACRVIVPDDQLSLAIGKEGQNARLAARLTGYKIDIKPASQAEIEE